MSRAELPEPVPKHWELFGSYDWGYAHWAALGAWAKSPETLYLAQLAEVMPDENDVNKPAKVDCDSEGRGGDDGADMFRYGVATKLWAVAPRPVSLESFQDRSKRIVVNGQVIERPPSLERRRIDAEMMDRLMGGGPTDSYHKYTRGYARRALESAGANGE